MLLLCLALRVSSVLLLLVPVACARRGSVPARAGAPGATAGRVAVCAAGAYVDVENRLDREVQVYTAQPRRFLGAAAPGRTRIPVGTWAGGTVPSSEALVAEAAGQRVGQPGQHAQAVQLVPGCDRP